MSDIIIHRCEQGCEEWERLRKGRATASQFHRIVTPTKLKLASGARTYAIELARQRLGIFELDQMPTYWMERGTEAEKHAIKEFERTTGLKVDPVGFVRPSTGELYGCSPDGFVGDDALIQVKCPKPETLIRWHLDEVLPTEHLLQVQGELWVTRRDISHFYGWHEEIEPLHIVVERDDEVCDALATAMEAFLPMVDAITSKVVARPATVDITVHAAEPEWV